MLKFAIAAACLCAATVAEAEPDRLSGAGINQLVAGATVELDTPLGTKLPIRYGADGKVAGQAGDLASYLGAASDTGRWWVAGDELCHKWNRWFDSEPQCLRLRKQGRTIHWRSQDGNSGTASIAIPAPIKAAAVPPSVQTESKMRLGPAALPSVGSLASAPPAEASAEASPPSKTAADEPIETPTVEVAAAVVPAMTTESSQQDKPPPMPALYVVANVAHDDVLNVRSGPSADFDVVGELQPGSRGVSITGMCRSLWCPVQHESTSGWVNRIYLANEGPLSAYASSIHGVVGGDSPAASDPPHAPRSCLTPPARALLERIEEKFGPVKLVSTCRPGATIAGSGRPSRHATGNAVDFDAGSRRAEIIEWLIANHHDGGTMTYSGMDHIHADIGPHFVSIAGGRQWASWRD